MSELVQKSYGGLLTRIALWSLVSLPCFWVPVFAEFHYAVDDSRLGIVPVLGLPFLALTAAMIIPALARVDQVLAPCSKGRRRVLSFVALAVSTPALGAIALVSTMIVGVCVYGMYVTLTGRVAR